MFFAQLGGIQEYGFHSGLEELMWATDQLNGALTSLDWPALVNELEEKSAEWTTLVIDHAVKEGAFFPKDQQWRTLTNLQEHNELRSRASWLCCLDANPLTADSSRNGGCATHVVAI